MTETPTPSRSIPVIITDKGRTFYDSLFSIRYHVVLVLFGFFFIMLGLLAGDVINLAVVVPSFLISGLVAYILWPSAPFMWYLTIDLSNGIVSPDAIEIKEAQHLLKQGKAQRVFVDFEGRATVVAGDDCPITDAHVIGPLQFLANVKSIALAIQHLKPLVEDYAKLKHLRGLEVGILATTAQDQLAQAIIPASSSAIGGLLDDLIQTSGHEPDIPEQTD